MGTYFQLIHYFVFHCSSEYSESRRSSRACSEASKRRYSSVQYEKLFQQEADRKHSRGSCDVKPAFELPGIQISRIETLDFGSDGRASICSGSTRSRGSRQYIIIHSDVASDFSRLSCPSDYSLAGSRSSRSRGSRASSNLSSRMWDFSPRESDWDADISLGSRESQLSVLRQDWGGGPMELSTDCLSPHTPRRLSVVTFDTGSPTLRRHSSPVCPTRRRESNTECTCGRTEYPSIMRNRDMSCHSLKFSDGIRIVESTARKRSADLVSCRSLRIDEDEREHIHDVKPHTTSASTQAETTTTPPSNGAANSFSSQTSKSDTMFRPPLRRNNTDDSEVERRVARLFKEIEYSVSESVDDSKIHSFSSDFDYFGRKVEAKEAETQTMAEHEMKLLDTGEYDLSYDGASGKSSKAGSLNDSLNRDSHDSYSSEQTSEDRKTRNKKKKSRSFEKTLSTISNALSALGRRSNPSERERNQQRPIPTCIVLQGLSSETDDQETAEKSPPPTYEDVINKNL